LSRRSCRCQKLGWLDEYSQGRPFVARRPLVAIGLLSCYGINEDIRAGIRDCCLMSPPRRGKVQMTADNTHCQALSCVRAVWRVSREPDQTGSGSSTAALSPVQPAAISVRPRPSRRTACKGIDRSCDRIPHNELHLYITDARETGPGDLAVRSLDDDIGEVSPLGIRDSTSVELLQHCVLEALLRRKLCQPL
jgi:hypothetical protein